MFLFLLSHQMLPYRLLWTQTFFFFTNVAHSQGERANGGKEMKEKE